MATADRESKKDKGIAFKSTHVSEEAVSDTKANMNESIDLLIKQFPVKKFKNLNTTGSNAQNLINYQRKDGQNGLNKYGLGFDASTRKINTTTEIKFVPASVKDKTDIVTAKKVVSPLAKTTKWICHYCGQKGHIRPFCYNLQRDILYQWKAKHNNQKYKASPAKQITTDAWHFDSGCSRHMTGNRSFFFELKECTSGHVTFGGGARGRILAKGNIAKNNLPCLYNVRYVDDLKANLISVSQLCDQGYSVNFSKDNCVVINKDREYHRKWDAKSELGLFLGYSRGGTDKTLFINRTGNDLIMAQIYADDIIFRGFPKALVDNFIDIKKSEFKMSMMGELSCFLGLQIKQRSEASRPDIAYAVEICVQFQSDPRTSHLIAVK
ncbi:gag-pol polyprotein [Cucumis melo var. makuwa]|uniref:Gag-pol polyprotein n=1 Tax=Cucumis melo var. makuwa TaxID=1194695 RepID=A0A5D3D205_CUCMM|nr:gag-pol polyprotein [Cucumis melo var. makuwa]